MKEIEYVVWHEGQYYVSQCLNVDVSSFGNNSDEAVTNLKEAVELYFENEDKEFPEVDQVFIGREKVHV